MEAAGVKPSGKRGPHIFRHARAVSLLRAAVPRKVIGDVLGHRSMEATIPYLKLATEDLRAIALEIPGQECDREKLARHKRRHHYSLSAATPPTLPNKPNLLSAGTSELPGSRDSASTCSLTGEPGCARSLAAMNVPCIGLHQRCCTEPASSIASSTSWCRRD